MTKTTAKSPISLEALAAPFPPEVISWRVGPTTKDKTRGMALAYIDARNVQDRLDEVCGIYWQTRHHSCGGSLLACDIGIKVGDEWVWRGDGAGEGEVGETQGGERKEQLQDMAQKGAFSDAFKRAAVRWGIGRYLYDIDAPWVELEQRGRSQVISARAMRQLTQMLAGKGKAEMPPEPPAEAVDTPLHLQAYEAAAKGSSALRNFWTGIQNIDRRNICKRLGADPALGCPASLKEQAEAADHKIAMAKMEKYRVDGIDPRDLAGGVPYRDDPIDPHTDLAVSRPDVRPPAPAMDPPLQPEDASTPGVAQ